MKARCGRGRGAWRTVRLFVLSMLVCMLVPALALRREQPTDESKGDPQLEQCGHCERSYVEALRKVEPRFAARAQRFLCPYTGNSSVSDAELVLAASPGTTGTRSLAHYLSEGCGLMTFHYKHVFYRGRPPQPHHVGPPPAALLDAELHILNDPRNQPEQADELMAEADLIGHVLAPQPGPGGILATVHAIVDNPADRLFYDLFRAFPRALFVLMDRDAPGWQESRSQHHPHSPVPLLRAPAFWRVCDSTAHVIETTYAAFQDLVRCLVPPERLLVTSYFEGDAGCSGRRVESDVAEFLERLGHVCEPLTTHNNYGEPCDTSDSDV